MRCYYCDFCPTAGSLSTLNERRSVKLFWDEKLKGWHCNGSCAEAEEDDTDEKYSIGQAFTIKVAVSE